jgi:hypothetical protein
MATLPICATIVFAIQNGFLKRWDYDLTMQRKTARQPTMVTAVMTFCDFGVAADAGAAIISRYLH